MKNKRISIKDIAKRANVSTASVSRVISHKPGVGKETEKRIREIMEEMGYKPNINARSLVKKNTGNIGVIIPGGFNTLQNSFFLTIIEGISSIIDQTEYNLIISFTSKQHKKMLDTNIVDGILVLAPRENEIDLNWISYLKLPTVIIGSFIENSNFDCISADEKSGVRLSIESLYNQNHRNIALINGPSSSYQSKIYEQGYKNVVHKLGLDSYILELEEFDIKGQEKVVEEFLIMHKDVTAVICSSDNIALGVINIANELNISIPEQLSIIGSDNTPVSNLTSPKLSTTHVNLKEIGETAVARLLIKLNNQNDEIRNVNCIFPMKYIERETTAFFK
ncbi:MULTISPECIES: LacI family DNA-binding transcriptional regulator [Mammaliicoccus]|uniref:LacI family DNA-binding transcriptional regulator n=1 Tax=Mammaliicoccus TaxID=2803850 RepID=UPI000E69552B|nr:MULTISPECIES: LacI family DNA-binding transcriptional regulator [Mammaliicoccus]QJF24239.1 LacI family transcriptional regulator [Mammaliicoccus vitulinus]QQT15334.1 LacI family DNA-binding transcriptional regulator [Mammaliicoccus vitulinus]QQY19364.1 LacI family DNA-binding transcriptional regulator [Mammaliicoccus vitulinus]RIN16299.1 LacI family transcriptional regulator [Mammaliicoccus vitulinus]RTX92403.1 LacI family transcriptional regulator [Mammaliicoccus vitulinus]